MNSEICFECGNESSFFDDLRGETICASCGLVLCKMNISLNPEWRAFNYEEEKVKSRVGLPPSALNIRGLRTNIGKTPIDARGKTLGIEVQKRFTRLSQVDESTANRTERNLKIALRELKRIKSHLNLPDDICETAVYLYKLALNRNLIRGRSITGMMSSAIYLACRKKSIPMTLKDIEEVIYLNKKEFGRCFRTFLKHIKVDVTSQNPTILVNRLGESLGLTMYTRRAATQILERAREKNLTMGSAPMSVAAAAIYIASVQTGEKRTQNQVALAARTTPVTIRNRFKALVEGLKISPFDLKRGAAAKPVIIDDPINWTHEQQIALK